MTTIEYEYVPVNTKSDYVVPVDVCEWKFHDNPIMEYWSTQCDHAFRIDDGTPEDNHFKYCPYCGKPIEVKE